MVIRKKTHDEVEQAIAARGHQLLTQYESTKKKLSILCSNGHNYEMNWDHFNRGRKCGFCLAEAEKAEKMAIVRKKLEQEGYTLLSEKYNNSHTRMDCLCPNGHHTKINWDGFNRGSRCIYCSKKAPVIQERVKKAFEDEGYQLLDKYTKLQKRLRFICPQGHKYSMTWGSFKNGTRCAICSGRIITRKDVRDAFSAVGYTLLSKYNNSNEKLDFICDQGHSHKIDWTHFKLGGRCLFCSKSSPVAHELIEQTFLSAGYTPLAKYQRADIKIPYICPEGHQDSMIWQAFKKGHRCPQCQGMIVTHEDVELAFASEGYELLDAYKNSVTPLRYICPEGHQHSIIWSSFRAGRRCAYCAGKILSDKEKEINAIKHRVCKLVQAQIKTQKTQKTFSVSSLSGKIAKTIRGVLGERPDGYHLDHIIPQSFFDFRNQHEIEACWHIDNLRYIPAFENMSKGNRLRMEDVEGFSESQLALLAKASRKPSIFDRYLKDKNFSNLIPILQTENKQAITPIQLSLNI